MARPWFFSEEPRSLLREEADQQQQQQPAEGGLDAEQQFHNTVRALFVCCIFFFTLYCIAHSLITRLKRQPDKDDFFPDDEHSQVYRIPYYLCTFSMTTSAAVVCLLPVSIISNEVLIRFPGSYYWQWLNKSLIFSLWNSIFFLCNISLFLLLPFAYFFTESEGLPGSRKSIRSKVYETVVSLVLLTVVVIGLVFVGSAIANYDQQQSRALRDIWYYYFPLLYSIMSLVGAFFHLLCTPRGFARLFTVMGKVLIKPQFMHDIEQERDSLSLEADALKRRILIRNHKLSHLPHFDESRLYHELSPQLTNGAAASPVCSDKQQLLRHIQEKNELEAKLAIPQWRRNLGYPLTMVLLLIATSLCVFVVAINTVGLLFGSASLPFVESDEPSTALGKDSLSKLGWLGAALEVFLILYFMLASMIGFYSLPYLHRLQPVPLDTPLHILIVNCIFILMMSSALPLVMRTLGLTNFDLIGEFGRLKWLRSLSLVVIYNVIFAAATLWCLVHTFTAAIRYELYMRYLTLQDQIVWSYHSAIRWIQRHTGSGGRGGGHRHIPQYHRNFSPSSNLPSVSAAPAQHHISPPNGLLPSNFHDHLKTT